MGTALVAALLIAGSASARQTDTTRPDGLGSVVLITATTVPDVVTDLWAEPVADGSGCFDLWWIVPEPLTSETTGIVATLTADDGTAVPVTPGRARYRTCPTVDTTWTLRVVWPRGTVTTHTVTLPVSTSPGSTSSAASAPPQSSPRYLVLTNSVRLDESLGRSGSWADVRALLDARHGPTGYRVLDFATDPSTAPYLAATDPCAPGSACLLAHRDAVLGTVASGGRPEYVVIVGGPGVVPFGAYVNPMQGRLLDPTTALYDNDTVWTDDLYGDLALDPMHVPDVVVTRLPDGHDFSLIAAVFAANTRPLPLGRNDAYVQSFAGVDHVRAVTEQLLNHDPTHPLWGVLPRWTPPLGRPELWLPDSVDAAVDYFVLHGSQWNGADWWGECPTPPTGYPCAAQTPVFTTDLAQSPGLIVSEACYGAYLTPERTAATSIALAFLDGGAFGFVGSTSIAYAPRAVTVTEALTVCTSSILGLFGETCVVVQPELVDPLARGQAGLLDTMIQGVRLGIHPADALLRAKQAYAASLVSLGSSSFGDEHKALHAVVYYGLPPVD